MITPPVTEEHPGGGGTLYLCAHSQANPRAGDQGRGRGREHCPHICAAQPAAEARSQPGLPLPQAPRRSVRFLFKAGLLTMPAFASFSFTFSWGLPCIHQMAYKPDYLSAMPEPHASDYTGARGWAGGRETGNTRPGPGLWEQDWGVCTARPSKERNFPPTVAKEVG